MTTSTADPKGEPSLAILDDWANIAPKHFSNIPNLRITSFPDTLSPASPTELTQLITRLQPYTILSTMRERTPLPSNLLSSLPNLRLILTTGVRNASIDLSHCKTHSITVAGTRGVRPAYYDADGHPIHTSPSTSRPATPPGTVARTATLPPGYSSTTQHTLSLLLALTSRVVEDDAALKSDPRAWQSGLSMPLGGKVVGIVGLGKLGAQFARVCVLALGMRVVAWSSSLNQGRADEVARELGLEEGSIAAVSKEELFRTADVVSVHYVLSERSRGLIGREELGVMKRDAVLVNTARGPIVDEEALLETLERGAIRGVALDVFWSREPLEKDSRWRTTRWGMEGRSRVVLSPHMGYVNESTMEAWYAEQAADVERWTRGEEVGLRLA
ncbi:2-hydroxyacid dehydrogenase-like protein 3 [Elsinoe australis]|uniref:2-hydroxyacid dehydrogenase-like protein 3 n=1 Tax=Elsinoe australis TaxID=40998 RepID=A0A4U7ARJ7_9PEZI|nr:2-hydroxyacid dehydrogenase-like protein 3 [Elsinoe australis]